jgi:NAD(P)-dependent dehydrogenase (short-subunit alcohol dehydrogenase family)
MLIYPVGSQQNLECWKRYRPQNEIHPLKGKIVFIKVSATGIDFASVEEIANTITYFASPLSAAINGAALKIDGGSIDGIL